MKAIQLITIGKPLQLREVPLPALGPDDVLIRVRAAGICHSDAHYRAGVSSVAFQPITLGHEIAGIAEEVGNSVKHITKGQRVCVHYLATCGRCPRCSEGHEQFCETGQMMGKHRQGGYAEFTVVPARSVFALPDSVSFAAGAVMMCSSATSFHALNKARLKAGETVALFGVGGLGYSALQLAQGMNASTVYAVDINDAKLKRAKEMGAVPVDARKGDAVEQLKTLTKGRGVDVSLELIGLPETMSASVRCLGIFGRAALVGLTQKSFEVSPYHNIINKEAEIIGVSDHLASELPALLQMADAGRLKFGESAIRSVPLAAEPVNQVLDSLERGTDQIRTVIEP